MSLHQKLADISDRVAVVKAALDSVATSHSDLQAMVDGKIMHAIEQLKAQKRRGMRLMATVGILAGGIAAGAVKVIVRLLG